MWPEWSAWTWWGLSLACLSLLAVPTLYDRRGNLALALIAGVIAVGAGLIVMEVRSAMIWVHPTLSLNDQEQAKAECEMQSLAAIAGRSSLLSAISQDKYAKACLTAKGFTHTRPKVND